MDNEPDLTLVPLTRDHFPLLVDWLAQPHVVRWWGEPASMDGIEAEYGPCLDGEDPTQLFLIREGEQPIGMVQIYRMADNPDYGAVVGYPAAGALDLFIGDLAACNRGLGTRVIGLATERIWLTYPEVTGALAGPSAHNGQSIRAFEKAGFRSVATATVPGEVDEEIILYHDRPTGA
jgi:aminoglycoside 6'-N-acetyltransferase